MKIILNILLGIQFMYLSIIKNHEGYMVIIVCNIVLILYLLPKINTFKRCKTVFSFINFIFIASSIYFYNIFIVILGISIFFEYLIEEKIAIYYILFTFLLFVFLRNISLIGEYSLVLIISFILIYREYKLNNLLIKLKKDNYDLNEKNKIIIKKIDSLKETAFQIEYNTKLKERNSISQKLHDKIGHTIAGSLIQLEAIKLISSENKTISDMLTKVIDSLREGSQDIRMVLKNIKPNKSEIGINNIRLMLKEFKEKANVETFFIFNGDIESISYRIMNVITQCLEEAITNFIKHSNGNKFSLTIEVMNKVIRVEIKDNGRNCNSIEKGMGLLGIEERISKINGKVTFTCVKGFIINIIIILE